jgi:hypothetical protein
MGVVAALAACSNTPAQPDTGEVSFALDGDGQQVYMKGSPRDPKYQAAYPLTDVDRLVVTIKQSGRLAAMCTRNGVTKTCDDTPFFAKITRSGASCAGVHTRVFDLKGALVADVRYAHYVGDDDTTHDYDPNGGSTHDGEPGSTADGTPGGTGGSSGGATGSGGGGTNDGSGCTTLSGCCATLSGGLKTGCTQMVGIADGSACTSLLGAYQSMGYCGGTHDGSPGGGGGSSGFPGSSGGSLGASGGAGGAGGTGDGSGGDDGCGGGTGDGTGGGGGTSSGATSGGGGSSGASGGSPGGSPGAGTSSGGTSSGGGTSDCSQSDFDQARAQFCAGVNQWLKSHSLSITIDCGQLDSTSFDVGAMYSQSAADFSCTDILEDSWWKAHDLLVWTDKCGASAETTLYNWKEEGRYQLKKAGACRHSPLVLDLDGDGVSLTALERGVSFDLLATGKKVRSAWVGAGDALLAIDWNGNGAIDGARELFGPSTFGGRWDDGFAALRELDRNGDGVVDAKDPSFADLLVWRDLDSNGVSKPSELVPLRDLGLASLVVTPERREGGFDAYGNQIPLVSSFVREDGTRAALVDAFFRFQP